MRQNRVLAIRGVRQQLLVAVSKRLLLIAILYAFLPHRASEKDTDNNLSERAAAPTANPKQLTEASESVDSSFDERSLRVDLVRLDRAVPAARCVGSRSPCASAPAQCPAAEIAEASGPQRHRPPVACWALSPGSRGDVASLADLPFYNADVEQRGFPAVVESFRRMSPQRTR